MRTHTTIITIIRTITVTAMDMRERLITTMLTAIMRMIIITITATTIPVTFTTSIAIIRMDLNRAHSPVPAAGRAG